MARTPSPWYWPERNGWYTILHTCPGMTISITADLRVQTNLDTAIPEAYNQSTVITPASGNRREEGGLTASITTYRFPNIPYHITVECTERTKKACTEEQELRALLSNIKLVSVPSTGGRGR